tara:strand:- start:3372 stop:3623 length:252 start_codon:yes stop_codon:yes gene_type:complete
MRKNEGGGEAGTGRLGEGRRGDMEGRESARCALKRDVSGLQSIRYASGISVASDHRKVWMDESFAQREQKLRSIDTWTLQRHP